MPEHAEKPSAFPHQPNSEEPADFDVNETDRPVPSDDDVVEDEEA